MTFTDILNDRKKSIIEIKKNETHHELRCGVRSVEGSISQRACVFCGSRVVLYPIPDTLHLVHGPIGCASFTWDIRGAISTGPQLHRNSFSTDLREIDVIYGGENKLYKAVLKLIKTYSPRAVFVYNTCIIGIIGDNVESVCTRVSNETGIPVIPVISEGFKGTKKDGYRAACESLFKLIEKIYKPRPKDLKGINILGEFNIAGEADIVKKYFEEIGLNVVSILTGNSRIDEISQSPTASLNLVQCSGSMIHLAKMMKEKYGIPYIKVSFFGLTDMSDALYNTAIFFKEDSTIMQKTTELTIREISAILPVLYRIKDKVKDKKAAIYVGGAFKAISLVRALRTIGIKTVLAGTQTGNKEDYETLKNICDEGTIIVDDSNPYEITKYIREKEADILIGGVKERPIAYKLGIGFCDHNHERKIPLAGFIGMLNFAQEIETSLMSPVFKFTYNNDNFAKGRY